MIILLILSSLVGADLPMKISAQADINAVVNEPLVADCVKKVDEKQTPREEFAALRADLNKDLREWSSEYQKAEAAEKGKLMPQRQEIVQKYGKRAFDLARKDYKSDVALDALSMAIQAGNSKVKKDAGEALVGNFADSDKMPAMIAKLAQGENSDTTLAALAEKSTKKEIKGPAMYAALENEIEEVDSGEGRGKKTATDADFTAVKAKLAKVIANYGDVDYINVQGKPSKINKLGEKQVYFLDNLVVGKTLPDIDTELLDGKKVKISDYRGKVVVLDIWATWCGPCKAMIPHERELTARLKAKPFEFISVSADDKKETLEKFLEKEEMPWTHWWDGRGGKLTEQYQVRFFPTVYVLDKKGVIRYKHVRGEDMDHAVDALLNESVGDKKGG
jgi:thiol-disulfide isomerase/thioredoxin